MLTAMMAMASVVMSSRAKAETKESCRTRSAAPAKSSLSPRTRWRSARSRAKSLSVGRARRISARPAEKRFIARHCASLASRVTRPIK